GYSLEDFRIVTTFGTGGTATGLSNYTQKKYGKKNLHVVYPLNNQDVAGIRTRDKSIGLKFYRPDQYLGQHEVDFEAAKPLFRYFARKGHDIGESSALAKYLNNGLAASKSTSCWPSHYSDISREHCFLRCRVLFLRNI